MQKHIALIAICILMFVNKVASNKQFQFKVHDVEFDIKNKVKIHTNSSQVSDGDWLEITVKGVEKPKLADIIAVYSPPGKDNIKKRVFAKYKNLTSAGYQNTGETKLPLKVTSNRFDIQLALIQHPSDNPKVIALSKVIKLKDPNNPLQGHLGVTGNNRQMVVQWNTLDVPKNGAYVKYGVQQDTLNLTSSANSSTYKRQDMCGKDATTIGFVDPGYTHTSILDNLEPGNTYYYQYGADDKDFGFSEVHTFKALPKVGPDVPVKFVVIADIGQNYPDGFSSIENETYSSLTIDQIKKDPNYDDFSLFHLHGDLAYADGMGYDWDRFFQMMQSIWTKIPAVFTEGNHERDYPHSGDGFADQSDDSQGECGVPMYNRVYMSSERKDQPWYSFDYGPIHFLHYSTEQEYKKGSKQYNFMVQDLLNVNRERTPWLVVAGHRPFYVDTPNYSYEKDKLGDDDINSDKEVQRTLHKAFEELYNQVHVDVTWQGHKHNYQRTCPVYKGNCTGKDEDGVPIGLINVVLGHAGKPLDIQAAKIQPKIFEKVIFAYGYTRVFANRTHFTQESVFSQNGTVMDSFTIVKPDNWGQKFQEKRLNQQTFDTKLYTQNVQ